MKFEHWSQVNDAGELQPSTLVKLKRDAAHFKGKRVYIMLKQFRPQRSEQQNRYIHALFTIFKDALNELGNDFTMEEIKELCKAKFLTNDVVTKDGEILGQRIKGTHELTKVEMITFVDDVIAWGATLGIKLPYPNEEFEIDFEE